MDFKVSQDLAIKKKLLLGFSAVISLMLAISLNNFLNMRQVSSIEDRLLDLRLPTILASKQLENGINLSLAGLQGYLTPENNPEKSAHMKKARMVGWKEIDDALNKIRGFSETWANPQSIEKLEAHIEELRTAQQIAEAISHSADEISAFKTLITNTTPRASSALAALTTTINQEATQEATSEHKRLLKLIADSRLSFALGLANIRDYLRTGDIKFRDNFYVRWDVNEDRFKQITAMSSTLSSPQHKIWNEYKTFRTEFAQYLPLIFQHRSGKNWNQTGYLLTTKTASKAEAVMATLKEIQINQIKLKDVDAKLLKEKSDAMQIAMLTGTVIAVIFAILIAILLSRSIVKPIERRERRAKEISTGDLTARSIEAKNKDELTAPIKTPNLQDITQQLSESDKERAVAFNQLKTSVEETNQNVENRRAETEHMASAMNEMNTTVQEIARHASMAETAANEADGEAAEVLHLIADNMQNITTLAEEIENAAVMICMLGNNTNSVDTIVAVINDIARQTNLLAINATDEAARATTQDTCFSALTDEVNLLAASIQQSIKEIRATVGPLKACAKDAERATNRGHQQTLRSVKPANTGKSSITDITSRLHPLTK